MNDQNPLDTLKKEAIEKYVSSIPTLTISDINMDASTMSNTAFDFTKEGLQTIKIKLSIVRNDAADQSLGYSYSETAAVKLKAEKGPQVILKNDSVTIDLGGTFNYTDNIGYISTSGNALPASLTETDNVDVNTEGTYTVNITAAGSLNAKTTVSYTVNVVKPAEVVRAEEEAAQAQEEAAQAEAEAQAAEEAAAANAAAAVSGYTGGISGSTGSAIADFALQFNGYSYTWGGTSPETGFDCSGLTQYVYAQFGISIPRSAEAQAQCGTIIPASEAQPGDLVTYNGHAAIYIGNNLIINALNPSMGVGISNMYALTNGGMQVHRLG
jgi:cell wall-associated NlpC family hydrolase